MKTHTYCYPNKENGAYLQPDAITHALVDKEKKKAPGLLLNAFFER